MNLKLSLALAAGMAFFAASASAATITLSVTEQGWITSNGANNGTGTANNYLAGNCITTCTNQAEFRDFFGFAIPNLTGQEVVSATLTLYTSEIVTSQVSPLVYQVTSAISPLTFNALGNGVVYGSRSYTTADANSFESIGLDAAALSAIFGDSGSAFLISGRVTSLTGTGTSFPDEFIYGLTGANGVTLTLNTIPTPVPGPLAGAGLPGFIAACAGLLAYRRRVRKAA